MNGAIANMLRSTEINRAAVAPVTLDVEREKGSLNSLTVSKIGREMNNVAHALDQRARCSGEFRVWFANFPESLVSLLVKTLLNKALPGFAEKCMQRFNTKGELVGSRSQKYSVELNTTRKKERKVNATCI